MKKYLAILMACLVTTICFGQKKHDKPEPPKPGAEVPAPAAQDGPTVQQMDSCINAIYQSFEADRQQIKNQIEQAEDTTFKKALSYQWNALETRCANRIWGYILSQPQCDASIQMMNRLRTTVDKEIVKKTVEQIKDKSLLESKAGTALTYFAQNEQAELGKKFKEVEVPALGTEGKPFKLSDEIKDKSILLILGATTADEIPATFTAFYSKLDHSSIDVVQIGFYEGMEEAANALGENKSEWRFYADSRGMFSPIILDYNIQDTPYCVLVDKGTGKISYMGIGITDELMGTILTK